MPNSKGNNDEFDIFIANSVFPEAEALFAPPGRSLDDLKDEAVIVLDTNALLVPYSIGKESLDQIRETYRQLVQSEQLIVPGQVAREFASNRANKISELFQQLSRKRDSTPKLQKGRYPLLESLDAYQEAVRLEKEIDELLKEYRQTISDVLNDIREWNWNDPVSLIYSELFSENVVLDSSLDKEQIQAELARRQLHRIAPGYKDASKDDSGVGDLLIWNTILEIGKSRQQDVIFVSGDQKTDWWLVSEKQPLYPRFELVDEYRRASDGASFHIVLFSQFLDLYGASDSTVQEVREEEQRRATELHIFGAFIRKWAEFEQALYEKCEEFIPGEIQSQRVTAHRMLQLLASHSIISEEFLRIAMEMKDIRNRVAHAHSVSDVSPSVVRRGIAVVDALINEL